MPAAEDVELALGAPQEAARAVGALDPAQRRAASGQRLVSVGLVPDVPDQPVARGVEHPVERHAQLDRAEAAREVAADLGADRDQLVAQCARDPLQLGARKLAKVCGRFDRVEERQGGGTLPAVASGGKRFR